MLEGSIGPGGGSAISLAMGLLGGVHHELTLFAGFWLIIGLIDDLLVDVLWLSLVLCGKAQSQRLPAGQAKQELTGSIAVFIPAWHETAVIGTTVRHALAVWPHRHLAIYVGCYANDPATAEAARLAGGADRRLKVVTLPVAGPTTKADCLNHLYTALIEDEARSGTPVRGVAFHDAEDMVHSAELALFDLALADADFVQLPVRAEPLAGSPWIAGHYVDEFAEAHAKTMVVRDFLGAALPAAGVGCIISRPMLSLLAKQDQGHRGGAKGPFAPDCLTEDYEIGWRIARAGGRARFLRVRDADGTLVATRAHFPSELERAVRQKTRWTHGIAYQGWDRLGWSGSVIDRWMALRDRRVPLAAAVLLAAYTSLLIDLLTTGLARSLPGAWMAGSLQPAWLQPFLLACAGGLIWRLGFRFLFSAHDRGLVEGLRSLLRAPVANLIAMASAYRALRAYLAARRGQPVVWDKTPHRHHPAAGVVHA